MKSLWKEFGWRPRGWRAGWMFALMCLLACTALQGCYHIWPVVNFGTLNVGTEFGLMNRYENPARVAGSSKEATETVRVETDAERINRKMENLKGK